MKLWFVCLTLTACVAGPAQAQHNHATSPAVAYHNAPQQFFIPPEHRVTQPPGTCMWQCTASAGSTLGHGHLRELPAYKKKTTDGGATQYDVRRELDARRVPYRHCEPGTCTKSWLEAATRAGHGVIVGVQTRRHDPTPTSGHAIIVVRVAGNAVTFWDPSAPNRTGTVSWEQDFKHDWFKDGLYMLPAATGRRPAAATVIPIHKHVIVR